MTIVRAESAPASGFEKVFTFLREQLLSGAILPGERLLGERDLALRLGVSRPMLREALRALAVLGVVDIRQGVGAVARRPDISILGDFFAFALARPAAFVDDVMQARIAIECQAARLACQRASLADFEQLRAALDGIVATIDDPEAGGLADHAFHAALVAAARSDTLSTLYAAITELLLRSHRDRRQLLARIADGRAYLIDHHRLIFDTLASHDADRADGVLREHFAIGDDYRRRTAFAAQPAQQPRISDAQENPA